MKRYLVTILQILSFVALLYLPFNGFADPDPDSIRLAKRIDMAMEEFYAIQAQNEWNDANGLSENNVYIFGMGDYLPDPEDDYLVMPSEQGSILEILYDIGALRDNRNNNDAITAIKELKDNLNRYNNGIGLEVEPDYEIWVYFTALNYQYANPELLGLPKEFINFIYSPDKPQVRGVFTDNKYKDEQGNVDYNKIYNDIKDWDNLTKGEIEEFEYRVYEAIGRKLDTEGDKKRIVFFCSYLVDIADSPEEISGGVDIKLEEDAIIGVYANESYSVLLRESNMVKDVRPIKASYHHYTYLERNLLAYPGLIITIINDYLPGSENMLSFDLSRPDFCTVASVCKFLGITEEEQSLLVYSPLKNAQKFQIISEATGRSLDDLYAPLTNNSENKVTIKIPKAMLDGKLVSINDKTFSLGYYVMIEAGIKKNTWKYNAIMNIARQLNTDKEGKALPDNQILTAKDGSIKIPQVWIKKEKEDDMSFFESFETECNKEIVEVVFNNDEPTETFFTEYIQKPIEDKLTTTLFLYAEVAAVAGDIIYQAQAKLQVGWAYDHIGMGFYITKTAAAGSPVLPGEKNYGDLILGLGGHIGFGAKFSQSNTILKSFESGGFTTGGSRNAAWGPIKYGIQGGVFDLFNDADPAVVIGISVALEPVFFSHLHQDLAQAVLMTYGEAQELKKQLEMTFLPLSAEVMLGVRLFYDFYLASKGWGYQVRKQRKREIVLRIRTGNTEQTEIIAVTEGELEFGGKIVAKVISTDPDEIIWQTEKYFIRHLYYHHEE